MYQISSKEQCAKLHQEHENKGGVYKLHSFEDIEAEVPMAIDRVLGADPEGVLYIGKTAPGLGRVGDLIKSLSPAYKSDGHHAGLRYAKNPKLSKAFPFESLCITFTPADNPTQVERETIQDYFMKYGEVPPLNANEP